MGNLTREALELRASDIFARLALVEAKKPVSPLGTIASLSPRVREAYLLGFGVMHGKDMISEEVGSIMQVSKQTVERYWRTAHKIIEDPAANTLTLR